MAEKKIYITPSAAKMVRGTEEDAVRAKARSLGLEVLEIKHIQQASTLKGRVATCIVQQRR